MTAADLVNAGWYGYAGWPDAGAAADFAATGGAGKGNPAGAGNGSGSGGYSPVSAPDIAKLREQVYGIVNPYYVELAKQAKGDFDTAVKMMTTDYSQGTRQAKEKLAYEQKYGTADLKNSLSSLGLQIGQENRTEQDKLNQRGMAVYQNNPDGTPNVVQPGTFNPTYDTNAYTYNGGVNASPTENLGQGGQEFGRLRQDQALRSEALLRTKMQPLEQAGLSFKQYTNPGSGFDINNPSAYTGDRSQLGTAETSAIKSYNTNTQNYRNTSQDLANQRSNAINGIATQYANTSTKGLDQNATNQLQKEYTNDFIQGGI